MVSNWSSKLFQLYQAAKSVPVADSLTLSTQADDGLFFPDCFTIDNVKTRDYVNAVIKQLDKLGHLNVRILLVLT